MREFIPSPVQRRFLTNKATYRLFGGGAGGGKTTALLLDALYYRKFPGWAGNLYRRQQKVQDKVGSLVDKARQLYRGTGARIRSSSPGPDACWGEPGHGARLGFSYLDPKKYEEQEQGPEYAWVAFDEVTHFAMSEVMYVTGQRMRTTADIELRILMSCNPDPDHWLRGTEDFADRTGAWVDWYLDDEGFPDRRKSGVLRWFAPARDGCRGRVTDGFVWAGDPDTASRLAGGSKPASFSYTPALVDDLPALMATEYAGNLERDPDKARVARMRWGNWNARPPSEGLLRDLRTALTDEQPPTVWRWRVRGWDKAGTRPHPGYPNPAYTAGVEVGEDLHGVLWILDLVKLRDEPGPVGKLMRATATADGRETPIVVQQDPAQGGKVDVTYMVGDEEPRIGAERKRAAMVATGGVLQGFRVLVIPACNKVQAAQGLIRRLSEKRVRVVRADWNRFLFRQADAFATADAERVKVDSIDAITTAERGGPLCGGGAIATPDKSTWERIAGLDATGW